METEGIVLQDVLPSGKYLPDLYDEQPIIILASYQVPGEGTITLRGRTGSGPWTRTIDVTLPAEESENDVIATLWAREKVDEILAPHLRALQTGQVDATVKDEVIALGKTYSIMTPFTSFVAVEKTQVISDGKPMLVRVPIELPSGTDWNGFFGDPDADPVDIRLEAMLLGKEADLEDDLAMDEAVEIKTESVALGVPAPAGSAAAPPPPPSGMAGARSNQRHFNQSPKEAAQLQQSYAPSGGRSVASQVGSRSGGRSSASRGGSRSGGRGRGVSGGGGGSTWYEGAPDVVGGGSGGVFGSSGEEMDASMMEDSSEPVEVLGADQIGRLVQVLDRPLFRLAVRALLLERDPSLDIDLTAGERNLDDEGKILVAIKVDAVDAKSIETLTKLGLRILATNEDTQVIVGMTTDRSLIEIGLLDGVLRVVPTEMKDASMK
jgi:uncharacterized membrane protein YgcG